MGGLLSATNVGHSMFLKIPPHPVLFGGQPRQPDWEQKLALPVSAFLSVPAQHHTFYWCAWAKVEETWEGPASFAQGRPGPSVLGKWLGCDHCFCKGLTTAGGTASLP